MGGNLFHNNVRLDLQDFILLKNEVFDILKSSNLFESFNTPLFLSNKKNFGDLDILCKLNANCTIQQLKSVFISEIKSNGNVHSIQYKNFQIDFILIKPENWNLSCQFFNWSDLGGLIGMLAKRLRCKLTPEGLFYKIKEDSGYIEKDILLSQDMKAILEFLDLSVSKYSLGFVDEEHVFEFIANSDLFSGDFIKEGLNKRSRNRNKKRLLFQRFLEYIDAEGLICNLESAKQKIPKTLCLNRINIYFPNVHIYEKQEDFNKFVKATKDRKEKFNGHLIKEWVGCEDKEIKSLKELFQIFIEQQEDFDSYLQNNSLDTISENFKEFYEIKITKLT